MIVHFGAAGAVVVSRSQTPDAQADGHPQVSLIFDPAVLEGEWERDRHGGVVGGAAVLTAFIASAMFGKPDHDEVARATARGLMAVRDLHEGGYQADADGGLAFPFASVVAAGTVPGRVFDRVALRDPARLLDGPAAAGPGQGATVSGRSWSRPVRERSARWPVRS